MVDKIPVPYLNEILVFLLAALTIAPVFKRLRLSPVLGYLVAGALIGPYALGFVNDIQRVQNVAELGVIFLMFLIGLELPLERLRVMRTYVFGLGAAQVLTCLLVFAGLAMWVFDQSLPAAIVLGGALALSSTALVLQLLSEREELPTKAGRASFSILLFQDLAVVPLLAIILIFSDTSGNSSFIMTLGEALLKALAAIVGIVLVGRYALRPIYRYVASLKSQEMFTAASLLIVLGISAATGAMNLSMALGAFLAGMMLAETEYRHAVHADILPFQGLLLGLFFMSVGMSIDFSMVADNAMLIAAIVLAVMTIKFLLVLGLARSFALDMRTSIRTAVLLAQGGEFAFVLLKTAQMGGIVEERTTQILLVSVAITMALTPILAEASQHLLRRKTVDVRDVPVRSSHSLAEAQAATHDLQGHAIIAGFGRVGKTVAGILSKAGYSYVAIDLDEKEVTAQRDAGQPVYYGDASRLAVLEALGAARARTAIITVHNPRVARQVLETFYSEYPNVKVLVRGRDEDDCRALIASGATVSVPENLSSSIQLGKATLAFMKRQAVTASRPAEATAPVPETPSRPVTRPRKTGSAAGKQKAPSSVRE